MLARRVRSVPESVTLALTARARAMKAKGIDVIPFTAGELDCPPPASLTRAVVTAMERGDTRYTDSSGTPELREAIARKLERDQGLKYDPKDILVSSGAKHSIYNLIQVLCDPGDEVVIPSPFWLSYAEMARLAEAVPVYAPTRGEDGFVLAAAALDGAITPRTRALIVNSPGNPTGAVFGADALRALAEVLRRHPHVTVISDEIYEKLVYDGGKHASLAEVAPDLRSRIVVVNGFSKSLAITGLRLGYAAGPREVIAAAGRLQSHSTSNPSSIVQAGAVAALRDPEDFIGPVVESLAKRRQTMVEGLRAIPGVSIVPPAGAFYCFPSLEGLIGRTVAGRSIGGAMDLCEACLDGASVVIVPGEPFGSG
ncbi:MAG TPA: pyridoxal phosphate-dependent aminotransferase, partial [Planctomycetota bacterium]|nr:pyridoxal phosphate-dependent aminotransferase [Planctomycetota bacterium]